MPRSISSHTELFKVEGVPVLASSVVPIGKPVLLDRFSVMALVTNMSVRWDPATAHLQEMRLIVYVNPNEHITPEWIAAVSTSIRKMRIDIATDEGRQKS